MCSSVRVAPSDWRSFTGKDLLGRPHEEGTRRRAIDEKKASRRVGWLDAHLAVRNKHSAATVRRRARRVAADDIRAELVCRRRFSKRPGTREEQYLTAGSSG
jgi:hypothetical protein